MTKYRGVNKVSLDTFNTGTTPSTTTWTNLTGADVSITSGQLDILDRLQTSGGADPGIASKATTYDVSTTKIMAWKWRTPSGGHTSSTELDFFVEDSAGRYAGLAIWTTSSSAAMGSKATLYGGGGSGGTALTMSNLDFTGMDT